jgi:sugar lactone lactonase YvrE
MKIPRPERSEGPPGYPRHGVWRSLATLRTRARWVAIATVVVVASASAQSVPAWHLVREATFSGGDNPAAELSDIRGIEVSKNGDVLVLDYKAQGIRLFAPDGHFLKTLSRNGEGPGEFEQPNGFARSPDGNIWVNDPANHRFTVLRDDGSYLKDVRSELTGFGYIWNGYFDASGRMVNPVSVANPKAVAPNGIDVSRSYHVALERRSMASNRADTIPELQCTGPGAIDHEWSGRSAHGGITMGVPFKPYRNVARSPHEFGWCAFGSQYAVYRLGLQHGDTLQVIHGTARAIPVTAAERDTAVERAKATFRRSQVDPDLVKAGDVPAVKPILIGLMLDDQNRLWVRLTPAIKGHTRYDVYNAKGVEIGTIDLPVLIREYPDPLIRGNKLYGVVLDADDVPSVMRFRIE